METQLIARREDLHLLRRCWHVLCGVSALSLYYIFEIQIVDLRWIALFIAILAFLLDYLRFKSLALNTKLIKLFSPILRESEYKSYSGLPFYALGISISLFFYKESIAVLSIIFLVFADPIASIIGVKYGKDKILPNKSLQGTIAAFFVCFTTTLIFIFDLEINIFDMVMFSVFTAIIGSFSELFSAFNIDDNLTIPVISGGGITFLNLFLKVL